MDKEDYNIFLAVLGVFKSNLEMDLDTKSYFFESANSSSFQEEYKILKDTINLERKILSLLERVD